jgi:hypothetical protein
MRGAVLHAPGDVRVEKRDDPAADGSRVRRRRRGVRKRLLVTLAAFLFIPLAGCAASQDDTSTPPQSPSSAQSPNSAPSTSSAQAGTAQNTTGGTEVGASRLRFATRDAEIVVRIVDNPTSRDFVSKLPLTLTFTEFAGQEKISYLPERLATEGSPGAAPRNGHLIYFESWGNLGFYYNAEPDAAVDDRVVTIGTFELDMDQLNRLEQEQVTVEVIE